MRGANRIRYPGSPHHAAEEPQRKEQTETRGIMARLFSNLTNVLPMSMDTKEFADPKNRDKILGSLREMRGNLRSCGAYETI